MQSVPVRRRASFLSSLIRNLLYLIAVLGYVQAENALDNSIFNSLLFLQQFAFPLDGRPAGPGLFASSSDHPRWKRNGYAIKPTYLLTYFNDHPPPSTSQLYSSYLY